MGGDGKVLHDRRQDGNAVGGRNSKPSTVRHIYDTFNMTIFYQ